MKEVDGEIISNNKFKKLKAQAVNTSDDICENLMPIGKCSKCGNITFMYLKSNPENICKYYCMGCENTGDISKAETSKDSFLFPLKSIVEEVAKHYSKDDFDKAYNHSK